MQNKEHNFNQRNLHIQKAAKNSSKHNKFSSNTEKQRYNGQYFETRWALVGCLPSA